MNFELKKEMMQAKKRRSGRKRVKRTLLYLAVFLVLFNLSAPYVDGSGSFKTRWRFRRLM